MKNVQLINKELLSDIHEKATKNSRKRINYDLRNSAQDTSQRMLNALEVGTHVPIHRHLTTSETVVCMDGCLDWVFYEELPNIIDGGPIHDGEKALDETCFKEISRFRVCPRVGKYGIQVPQGVWHSIEVYEPSTILEAKDGPYQEETMIKKIKKEKNNMKKKKNIHLCLAHMSEKGDEMKYINRAFDEHWVAPLGPNVDGFEEDLKQFIAAGDEQLLQKEVVALASGTAAVHLGLVALGVGPGDEVLAQSFTFCASMNPIRYLGATPIIIDSEPDTWNMDPELLEAAILDRMEKTGKKPKAIVTVYLYGMPAKIDEIMAIARKYDIPVLEDAAEAFGSEYKGRYVYLNFVTIDSYACVQDLEQLKLLNEKTKGVMDVISISIDEDFDSVKKFFKRNGYNWTLLDTKGDMSVVESYKVKVYPSYFLIDVDGTLCMSPATSPSEGFESRFKQLFQSRRH